MEELSIFFLIEGFKCENSICVGKIKFCNPNLIPHEAQKSFQRQLKELKILKPLSEFVCAVFEKIQAKIPFIASQKGLVDLERALDIMTYALFSKDVYRGRSTPYYKFEVLPISYAIRMRDNWGTPVLHLFEKKGTIDARFATEIEQFSKDYDFLLRKEFDILQSQTELEQILTQTLNWYREAEFFLKSHYRSRLAYLMMWIALEHLVLADIPLYKIDPKTGAIVFNKNGKPIRYPYSKIGKIKERVIKIIPVKTGPSFEQDPKNWTPNFDPKSTLDDLYNTRNEIIHQATYHWEWESSKLGPNIKNWPNVVEKIGTLKYILSMVIDFMASNNTKYKTMKDIWSSI